MLLLFLYRFFHKVTVLKANQNSKAMDDRNNMTKNKKNPEKCLQNGKKAVSLHRNSANGGLAQLARALAWHARGHRFESDILHHNDKHD